MIINSTTHWPEGGLRDPQAHPAAAHPTVESFVHGRVRFAEGRDKFAIVGFASSTRDAGPFDDPSWVVCGVNQLYRFLPRADLWCEMHTDFLADQVPGTDYLGWLKTCGIPVLMPAIHPEISTSVRFPLEDATTLAGEIFRPDVQTSEPLDYYQSSIGFMIAWALLLGFKEIGVWGVDLTVGDEYTYQKPNAEFWLGLARGMGVKLTIPKASALLKQIGPRYGSGRVGDEITRAREIDRMIARRQAFLDEQMEKQKAIYRDAERTLEQMEAARAESALWKNVFELNSRGTVTEYNDPVGGTST